MVIIHNNNNMYATILLLCLQTNAADFTLKVFLLTAVCADMKNGAIFIFLFTLIIAAKFQEATSSKDLLLKTLKLFTRCVKVHQKSNPAFIRVSSEGGSLKQSRTSEYWRKNVEHVYF